MVIKFFLFLSSKSLIQLVLKFICIIFPIAATLSALATPENQDNYKSNLNQTSMKLGKTLTVEEIRSLVEKKKQKKDTSM